MFNLPSKFFYYVIYFVLFVTAQGFSMWGQYFTLPYKNLTMWEAYKMAIPFAWLDWLIMTFVVNIGNTYDLVTPTQDTFLLIIIQFVLILIINQYYLKQKIYRSDIIAFFIILFGFFVSFFHLVSKYLGIPIPSHDGDKTPDEAHSTIKVDRYDALTGSNKPLSYAEIASS